MDWNKILKSFLGKSEKGISGQRTSIESGLEVRNTDHYKLFKELIYDPRSVFYPACGPDVTPAKVFYNVIFLDIQKLSFEKLQKNGYKAIHEDVKNHSPNERYDLLILSNPQIKEEDASQHLVSGGYVITNNAHGNAAEMYWKPDKFELIGAFQKNGLETKVNRNTEGFEFIPNSENEPMFSQNKKGTPNKKIGDPYIFRKK